MVVYRVCPRRIIAQGADEPHRLRMVSATSGAVKRKIECGSGEYLGSRAELPGGCKAGAQRALAARVAPGRASQSNDARAAVHSDSP